MRRIVLNIAVLLMSGSTATANAAQDPLAPVDNDTVIVTARSSVPASPHIFGTVALGAGVTTYGARWRRVSAADEHDPRVAAIAAAATAAGSSPVNRIAYVQAAIGDRIHWRRDLDTYHVFDYWAQAGETLTRGEGDSEDIAILKMQILKATGISARDLYLSLGRDQRSGSDVRLVVRVGSQFYTLDDRGPVNAATAKRFEPVITLGRNSAWLHGHRYVRRASLARLTTR